MLIYQVLIILLLIKNQGRLTKSRVKIYPQIFKKALKQLEFTPNLDCCATGINAQLDRYVSYKPDPYAFLIDAFTVNWQLYNCIIVIFS